MLLDLYTWNGTQINNGTTFEAYFPFGQPSGATARANFAGRARTFAFLAGKEIGGVTLSFHIICKGTIHEQYETLKAMFPIEDHTPRSLVVRDLADSNKEWYVQGYALQPPTPAGSGTAGEYVMTLALKEPLWRSVLKSTDTLEVALSGDDEVLTVLGNHPAKPKFTLTIGAARAGGFTYRWWRPFYNPLAVESAEPLELTGGWNTAALVNDTTVSNQINQLGGISAAELSIPIDTSVGGGLPTAGGLCYVDSEQIYYTSISAGVMTVYDSGTGVTGRGWGGTTAATHADNAVMARSKVMANGQDVRVLVNRAEVDVWFSGFNGASTKVWINQKFAPLVSLTVDTALGAGSLTTITFKKVAANATALKKLPSVFMLQIGNEAFLCRNADAAAYRCTVVERAYRGTSAASHASGATARWVEHDIFIVYGNALAEAQAVDNTRKPMLNLSTSTNTSWDWDEFADVDGLRTAGWVDAIVKSANQTSPTPTYAYTDTQGALADPATVIGVAARSYVVNNVAKAETFDVTWRAFHPAGFTTVTCSGSKRRTSTGWATNMSLFKSPNGTTLTQVFKEASPSAANAWEALSTHSGVALGTGTWRYLVFRCSGSMAATLNNENDMEFSDFTAVITSGNVVQTPFSSFTPTAENSYYLDATLSITETGESIRLRGTCKVGSVIVVDTDAETLTVDGNESGIDIDWNTVRLGWLDLPSPKQSTTCTLVYTETGVSDVEVAVEWENRNTL